MIYNHAASRVVLPKAQSNQPSTIARRVAAREWPSVHSQKMVAPGVYWFSCSGHGGCVAIHGVADISDDAWRVAILHGLTEVDDRSGATVWVGEEDCAWSTIFVAHNDVHEMIRRADERGFRFDSAEYAERTCERWYPEVLSDIRATQRKEVNDH